MTQTEALRLALEVLKAAYVPVDLDEQREQAITAIKASLSGEAQTRSVVKDEPVAWMNAHDVGFKKSEFGNTPTIPLYTHPQPQRKPLTDEEIQDLLMPVRISGDGYYLRIARAIEAAHGIKEEA